MKKVKNKPDRKITVLWGLPAAGKTTYAAPYKRQFMGGGKSDVINLDALAEKYLDTDGGTALWAKFLAEIESALRYSEHLVLDGLITTNKVARSMIDLIRMKCPEYHFIWEIVFWVKDVDACLWNDKGRREKNSEITIRNVPFEEPSKELRADFGINDKRFIRRKVVRKSTFEAWCETIDRSQKDGKMRSSTWSLGGTSGNCWSSELSHISPESPPTSFVEFDDLVEKICPEINFLKYKKIYAECVTTEERSEGDYYGGCEHYANYVCDLQLLYKLLKEEGLVKEDSSEVKKDTYAEEFE